MKKLLLFALLFSIATIVTAQTKQRCAGIKRDGTQCKMTVIEKNGYCRFHNPDIKRCAGIKKDQTQCRMTIQKDETYCHHHKPKG